MCQGVDMELCLASVCFNNATLNASQANQSEPSKGLQQALSPTPYILKPRKDQNSKPRRGVLGCVLYRKKCTPPAL